MQAVGTPEGLVMTRPEELLTHLEGIAVGDVQHGLGEYGVGRTE